MSRKPKSLVFITVDCLRADHCGFYGYSRPTTPFLDTLAGEAAVVPTAVVAGAPTYYSLPAILASRMPLALGRDVIGLAPGESTLATALHGAGYATAAFSAANPYISARFGYDQGFEVFEDFLEFEPAGQADDLDEEPRELAESSRRRTRLNRSLKRAACTIGLGSLYDELYFQYCLRIASSNIESIDGLCRFPSAEKVLGRAISWLNSVGRQPFFLWLHLMDPHSPYYPSADAFREFSGRKISARRARYLNEFWNRSDLKPARLKRKRDSVLELYDAGIRSVDAQVARLALHLKQAGVWDDCALVLTADHGEEFLEHGRRYHAPVNLAEEITRVPLLIRAPSAGRPTTRAPFSHLHLAPTLLDMLEVPAPSSFRGRSLWDELQHGTAWRDAAIAECVYGCNNPFRAGERLGARLLSVRNARHKLVLCMEPGRTDELYDLEADPGEERPLPLDVQKEVRSQLLRAVQAHVRNIPEGRGGTIRLSARLRDLGIKLRSRAC